MWRVVRIEADPVVSSSARNRPRADPVVSPPAQQQADGAAGGVIGSEERRGILTDSEASLPNLYALLVFLISMRYQSSEEDADAEDDGEPCVACGGGSGEKRQLPCGPSH